MCVCVSNREAEAERERRREHIHVVHGPSYAIVSACVRFSCTSALPLPLHLSFCNIKCCHSIIETAAFFRQPQRMDCSPAHKDTPGPKESVKLVGEYKPFSLLRGLTTGVTAVGDIVIASEDK